MEIQQRYGVSALEGSNCTMSMVCFCSCCSSLSSSTTPALEAPQDPAPEACVERRVLQAHQQQQGQAGRSCSGAGCISPQGLARPCFLFKLAHSAQALLGSARVFLFAFFPLVFPLVFAAVQYRHFVTH